jgi:hypothetical protein
LLLLLPLLCGGCCSLARLFCGPDTSDWEQIAYDTPQHTLATFLAAIRRDNAEQARRCMSAAYQERHDLNGPAWQLAWQQLRRDNPYLYMLGYVQLPDPPPPVIDRGCTYVLEARSKKVQVRLARQTFVQVVYELPDGTTAETGGVLPDDSWNGRAKIEPGKPLADGTFTSRVDLTRLSIEHGAIPSLTIDRLDLVALGREWKIDDILVLD